MTIHSEFWRERQRLGASLVVLATGAQFVTWQQKRDSNRKRCYKWEWEDLRPVSNVFKTRQAAKGYARLCAKIAIRRLVETGKANEKQAEIMRKSFKAAFTKERINHCNANLVGCYFAEWGWTDVIIAHEVAHWADSWDQKLSRAGQPHEGHGPHWRGWFVHLLSNAGMANFETRGCISALMLNGLESRRLRYVMP